MLRVTLRVTLTGVALLMVGGVTAGCLSTPTDADTDEFCAAAGAFFASADEVEFEAAREKLADIGTPAAIEGQERSGFRYLVKVDWEERDNSRRDDEKIAIAAFVEAYRGICDVS